MPASTRLTRDCLTEEEEQKAIIEWAELHIDEYPELRMLRGGLEGVNLPIGLAVKAKKLGMKAGWPDLHLPCARTHGGQHFNALFIELKALDGRPSHSQIIMLDLLANEGNFTMVSYGAKAAIKTIVDYLRIEE